jgi:membrane-bound serine protease (ClpP class)
MLAMAKKIFLIVIFFSLIIFPGFSKDIRVLDIQDQIISPVIQEYIENNLKEAVDNNEAALLIRINTPGGLLKPTQAIVRSILNSEIPVIVYVWPKGARAVSAGTFIGYAASVFAMSPSTHIGAAHPVSGGGSWGKIPEVMQKKLINDTLAWAKNITEARKRPYQPLREMIKESKSFTEKEALQKKVIDLIAEDTKSLLEKIKQGGLLEKTAFLSEEKTELKLVPMTKRQNFLNALLSPNLVYLLFTLGFLGLIFEVTNPGFGFPGIAGLICLITSLYAFSALPVNYAGLALIALGIIFLIVEAFTPTFGLFAGAGLISFVLGSLFLFRGPAEFKVPLSLVLPLAVVIGVWNVFVVGKIIQARIRKPQGGPEGLIGEIGKAYTKISKKGKVFIHGEIWNAQSNQKIKKGEDVEVVAVNGLRLTVKKGGLRCG